MKYDRKAPGGKSPPERRSTGKAMDPMETFDMVNRHTEMLVRQAQARKQKAAGSPSGSRSPSDSRNAAPRGEPSANRSPAASRGSAKPTRNSSKKRMDREEMIRRNVKRHRVRHKKNYILYYFLLLFIAAAVGITLSLTVFFKIEAIEVEGNGSIPADSLIAATGIKKEDNLFRVSTDRAEKSIISQFVTVDKAVVSRKLPNRLHIKVEPSQIQAVARYENRYYSISKGSRVIDIAEVKPDLSGIPVVVGCDYSDVELGDYLDKMDVQRNKLETMGTVLDAIEENSLKNIGYIDLSDIAFIKLYYEDRLELKMGSLTDFSYELGRAKQLIQETIPEGEFGVLDVTLHNGKYFYRDTSSITLPEGEQPSTRPKSDGVAGYDLPGDEAAGPSGEDTAIAAE